MSRPDLVKSVKKRSELKTFSLLSDFYIFFRMVSSVRPSKSFEIPSSSLLIPFDVRNRKQDEIHMDFPVAFKILKKIVLQLTHLGRELNKL